MAKQPTPKKAAAGDKPAVPPASAAANQSPGAGAASAASEPGGAPQASPADRSASELGIVQPPGGDGATSSPSSSSNDTPAAADLAPATEPAVAGNAGGDLVLLVKPKAGDDALTLQIASVREAAAILLGDVSDLVELARVGPEGSLALALAAMGEVGGRLTELNHLVGALQAAALEDEADLEPLSVRSRDGKPFRRAGLVLGDAYETYRVTAEQAELIRSDRRGCQIEGEN